MTYKRLYQSFKKFIDQDDHFTEAQQEKSLESFKQKRNKNIFRLSIILLVWSVVGITIDSLIIGGSIIGVIMQGLSFLYLLPTLIFSAVNFIFKSIFVKWYLKNEIPMKQILLAGIPYLGSASIIAYLVRSDPLFGAGIQHYLSYLRKRGLKYFYRLLSLEK